MKKLTLFFIGIFTFLSLSAQQVTQEAALKKAEQFLDKASLSRGASRKAPQLILANNRDEFYVFNDKGNGGYVIVSGEERMPDVLAYSYDSRFDADNIPCNMKAWLEGYAEQVKYLRTHPEASARRTTQERKNVGPLLTCWFNQNTPYNDKCPLIDGKHGYTGCVATAMAQIMYYWQWPKQTTDVIPGYITEYRKIDMPEMPITTIDWDNILGEYKSEESYTAQQIDAISTLMLLCGASVHMNYWEYGSGATTRETVKAFREYFSYSDLLEHLKRYEYSTEDWEDLIYDELKDRRPVLYSGYNYSSYNNDEGHAFVLDGYEDGFFHINWGWGGKDAYVLMTSVAGWEKYGNGHEAVVGIQPATIDTPNLYAVVDNGKMSFYYDKEKTHRPGTILPYKDDWANYKKETTECVIDPSFANIKQKRMAVFFSKFFFRWYNLEFIEGLENLNTSMLTDMSEMFLDCSNLKSLDLSGFKTDNVSNMESMFGGCSSLTNLDVSSFKTDKVTNMESMFSGCSSLTNLDVRSFRTDKVTNMKYMFSGCSSLTSLDLGSFDTSNVNNMRSMFAHCSSLKDLDLSSFKTDKVTNMSYMFNECKSLTNLDVSTFRTNKVTQMNEMFYRCPMLVSIDVSGFRTDKVTLMTSMFEGCSSLSSLDLSGFKTDMVKDVGAMFRYCSQLSNVYVSESWNLHNVEFTYSMFAGCSSIVGGKGTTYDFKHVGGDYAHIDEGPSNPGYLTYKAPQYYTITYMVDDEEYASHYLKVGTTITAEAEPTKEGYTFSGWSEIPETMPAKDVTITGTFTVNKYKLIYKVDGEEYKISEVKYGTTITAEAEPTKEGYTFSGWSEIPETMPAKDVVITGSFSINSYTITYKIDGEVYQTETVEYGSAITPPEVPARGGFTFEWIDVPETMPAKDITIVGSYTSGIGSVYVEDGDVKWCTIDGQRIVTPRKGLNIMKISNGKTKKVVVKL